MPSRIEFHVAADGEHVDESTDTPDMVIKSNGNIGIGTSDPGATLHVVNAGTDADILTDSDATAPLDGSDFETRRSRAGAIVQNNDKLGSFRSRGYNGSDYRTGAVIRSMVDGTPGAGDDMPTRLEFHVAADGERVDESTDTPDMVIKSNGNIGIGISDPQADIHINRDSGSIAFTDANDFTDTSDYMLLDADTDNLRLKWFDDSASTLNNLIMFTNAGEVGIGDDTPDSELDVVGDIEYTGVITDVSDRRLKENINKLESTVMLDRLMKVDGYTFQMIDRKDDDRVEYGVIAQEIEAIFPELVHTEATEEAYKSVNYTGLITPIIEAVKELYSKVLEIMDQIKVIFDKIAQLENENAQLQAEVDALKQQNNDILKRLESIEANVANDNKVEASFDAESTLDIQASGI